MKQKGSLSWTRLKNTVQTLRACRKDRSRQRRRLRDRLRWRDALIARQQREIERLRTIVDPQPVYNCVYPAQMMLLAVYIVLHGGSLRCAAATVGCYAELMGWTYRAPAFKTVSNWVERCGLHALQLTRSLSGEYVAIMDSSIQIGKEQLLLLLGVEAERAARLERPLTVADVTVLGMEVQPSWTGEQVADFVTRTLAERAGLSLRYVICDRGTNLMAALRALALPVVSDCSHVMMNLVKKLFADDEALSRLRAQVGQLRLRLTLTDYGFLLPATLRDKDRFGRIFTLVEWMDRIDRYAGALPIGIRSQLMAGRDRWLDLRLRQVHALVQLTARVLKYDGLSQTSRDKWLNQIVAFVSTQPLLTRQAKDFIAGMRNYFTEHADAYAKDATLQCCSDIIESIFGRYKNKGGMKAISADVLSIALYNQPLSIGFIQQAMRLVSGPQLDGWRSHNVCHNRYGIRRRMERELQKSSGG